MPLGLTLVLVVVTAIGPLLMCSTARSAKWRSSTPKYIATTFRSIGGAKPPQIGYNLNHAGRYP